jgi:hypothetical protein
MEEVEVSTEHLHEEIIEHHPRRDRWTMGVALSSAILAAFAALGSLLAGHHANEGMMSQIEASDLWSYYQPHGIKEAQLRTEADIMGALGQPASVADGTKISQHERDKEQIQQKAESFEGKAKKHHWIHEGLAASVTMFQIAIVLGAVSVLMRQYEFWLASLGAGAIGVLLLFHAILTPLI